MNDNPSKHLSQVKVKDTPTDYFTLQEMRILLNAVDRTYTDQRGWKGNSPEPLRNKVLAFLPLLRWSGLRCRATAA